MDHENFIKSRKSDLKNMRNSKELEQQSKDWIISANNFNYSYHFDFMGRPIIQYPQDIVATQELIWNVKPDLIIETGVAHGGSIIMSAGLLALVDLSESIANGTDYNPLDSKRRVIGIDVDIREHNLIEIKKHPMFKYITLLQGSSTSPAIFNEVYEISKSYKNIMVFLDSNHTHNHVLEELELYAPLVSIGSYCIVFDTIIEELPINAHPNRPWGIGDNPKTAVMQFLKNNENFKVDTEIDIKLLISVAPGGYLKRIF